MSISRWWQLRSTILYSLCFSGILIIGMKFRINCTRTTFHLELIMPGHHFINNCSNFQFRIAAGLIRQSDLESSAAFWYLFPDILNLKNTPCLFIFIARVYLYPQFRPINFTWIHHKPPFWLSKLAQTPQKHNFDSQKRNGSETIPGNVSRCVSWCVLAGYLLFYYWAGFLSQVWPLDLFQFSPDSQKVEQTVVTVVSVPVYKTHGVRAREPPRYVCWLRPEKWDGDNNRKKMKNLQKLHRPKTKNCLVLPELSRFSDHIFSLYNLLCLVLEILCVSRKHTREGVLREEVV